MMVHEEKCKMEYYEALCSRPETHNDLEDCPRHSVSNSGVGRVLLPQPLLR